MLYYEACCITGLSMEDKRIVKTKRNLRATMAELICQMPFEKITVAEICRQGMVSRITFYTHYDTKYELLDELLNEYADQAKAAYRRLQETNNPQKMGLKGYENMLECILEMLYENAAVFSHVNPQENPYLTAMVSQKVTASVNSYLEQHRSFTSKYPIHQTVSLICSGLYGVLNTCTEEKMSPEESRRIAKMMLRDIMKSDLFDRG